MALPLLLDGTWGGKHLWLRHGFTISPYYGAGDATYFDGNRGISEPIGRPHQLASVATLMTLRKIYMVCRIPVV